MIASSVLDNAYRRESNANVRERILLIRRIMSDGQDIRMVSKEELHRSIAWAYKWLRRFDKEGLEGLKNKHRSGRPPDVPQEKISKIRTELSENPSGWKAKEIMNIIYEKTGIRYHEVHIYRLLHKWGFSPKVPRKRFVNTASNEEKKQFQKRPRK
ncbi:MAG TPA: helix-turn-helix domain-containing protein [Nitrososphaeraceae archaeon]|nr:helix-turn-helix domain-containing protein [Nitrososphaeraceae archaeon]